MGGAFEDEGYNVGVRCNKLLRIAITQVTNYTVGGINHLYMVLHP